MVRRVNDLIPLRRMGEPGELARVAEFLLSDAELVHDRVRARVRRRHDRRLPLVPASRPTGADEHGGRPPSSMRTCTSSISRSLRLHYSWLQPEVRALDPIGPVGALQSQRYWPEDFLAESRFSEVEAVIHVDAASDQPDPVAETRWIQAFNDRLGVPHAHIARCDLARPDAGCQSSTATRAYPGAARSPRPALRRLPRPRSAWRRGFALLADTGLVCCMDPLVEQMGHAAALIEAHELGRRLHRPCQLSAAPCTTTTFRAWRRRHACDRASSRTPSSRSRVSARLDHRAGRSSRSGPGSPTCIEEFGARAQSLRLELAGRSPLQSRTPTSWRPTASSCPSSPRLSSTRCWLGNARRIFRLDAESKRRPTPRRSKDMIRSPQHGRARPAHGRARRVTVSAAIAALVALSAGLAAQAGATSDVARGHCAGGRSAQARP